ncbi:MAG: FG-GAP-like repeat-containing protein [Candidatus Krumholzibacteria bacterium]|nr:FG-GAP-like repeat-containing protein [Candidatus Krumholzibacteria bacterium]
MIASQSLKSFVGSSLCIAVRSGRFLWCVSVVICVAVVAAHVAPAVSSPALVTSVQKISDVAGNFPPNELSAVDFFGKAVAGLGDLDNDGFEDIAVGVQFDDDGGQDRGAVWVLFLNGDGTVKSYQKISDGQGGFPAGSLSNRDRFGAALAALDVNRDGVTDLAVGAFGDSDNGPDHGAVWVLFLNNGGTVDSAQKINESQGGFSGSLSDGALFGAAVGAMEDLDGDGVPELVACSLLDDDGGTDRGAVWVLFLNSDGTVKNEQKISDTQGGFAGMLENDDRFGSAIAVLGDLDGDGVNELAVSAIRDDDGGQDRGAIYVLFMNNDGTVSSFQKISSTQGGFSGSLTDDDSFGASIAPMGDLDADGMLDMAVGAHKSDAGGTNRGAVWVLYLNDDGTVKSHEQIGDNLGGFPAGGLANSDFFGVSATPLGDLNGDLVPDLVVGAMGSDDGGDRKGAVWVLFLGCCAPPFVTVSVNVSAFDLLGDPCPGGVLGITMDLDHPNGDMFTMPTDATGNYTFTDVPQSADLAVVAIVPPLGYVADNPATGQTMVPLNQSQAVNFTLICEDPEGEARSMGYWKHQANVYLKNKGSAQELQDDMETNYPWEIFEHFHENSLNAIEVEDVTYIDNGGSPEPLDLATIHATLSVKGNAGMEAKAKQQYLTLLLNIASLKLLPSTVVSDDPATASQALQYVACIINQVDCSESLEVAKDICDTINNAQLVAAGVIDLGFANIAYAPPRGETPRFVDRPLSVRPNPGGMGPYRFSFSTPVSEQLRLEIYNVAGQRVATLTRTFGVGDATLLWNGKTTAGSSLVPGVYFARLRTATGMKSVKFVHVR